MCAETIITRLQTMDKLILEFWRYSEGKTDTFDFPLFFSEYRKVIYSKLARHGALGFRDYLREMANIYNFHTLRYFAHKTHDGYSFHIPSITTGIFMPRYRYYRRRYLANVNYQRLLETYQKCQNAQKQNHQNMVLLVDECIHATHNSGSLLNVELLRKEYESLNP